jgi:cytochrome oxidase Cu insertion factor (SCO1/SenC/PrrC family)
MILNNILFKLGVALSLLLSGNLFVCARAAEGLFPRATVLAAPPQPTKVPEFDFVNLQGGALKSSELKGKVIIIRFWATW